MASMPFTCFKQRRSHHVNGQAQAQAQQYNLSDKISLTSSLDPIQACSRLRSRSQVYFDPLGNENKMSSNLDLWRSLRVVPGLRMTTSHVLPSRKVGNESGGSPTSRVVLPSHLSMVSMVGSMVQILTRKMPSCCSCTSTLAFSDMCRPSPSPLHNH